MTLIRFIIGLIVVVSVGVAVAIFWSGGNESSSNFGVGAGWQTYRDDRFGYVVAVPATWVKYEYPVLPEPGLMTFFSRRDLGAPLEMSADDLSLAITVRNLKMGENLETIAGRTQRNLDGLHEGIRNIISESTQTVIDGRDAIIQREETPPDADSEYVALEVLYVADNDRLFMLSVLGTNSEVISNNALLIRDIFKRFDLPDLVMSSKNVAVDNTNQAIVKTFSSERLGITFRYASEDLGKSTIVEEVENTVYVYPQGTNREDGQFVRVFTKDRNVTLQQAIQQDFLKGYNQADCFVKDGSDVNGTTPEKGIAAIIAYPISDTTNDQWLKNAEKCPKEYSFTNGVSYFWTDTENANRYVFFSIGQYYIPVESVGTSWHSTLEFIR